MSEKRELTLDPEFVALSLASTDEENALLRASLQKEGCREPLVVWAEKGIILDGHRRFAACNELRVKFKKKLLSFTCREEAHTWVVANQLARRNLTEEQKSYLRGKRYRAEQKSHGGSRWSAKSKHHDDVLKTSQKLAMSYGVGSATIERDARFADAIDALAEVSSDAKGEILSGKLRLPRKDLFETAKLEKEARARKVEAMLTGKMVKQSPFKGPPPFAPRVEADKLAEKIRNAARHWPPKCREYLRDRLKKVALEVMQVRWSGKHADESQWEEGEREARNEPELPPHVSR